MGSLLGIGAGAGFVSALLFAVVTTGNPLAIILYLVAPLPVLLAALGWNHRAGLAAAVAGTCMVGLAFSIPAGLLYLLSVAGPAWWFGYLVLLARTEGSTTEWYPLGRLLLWMVAISSVLTFVGALMLATDYDAFVAQFERVIGLIEQINPNTFEGVGPEGRTQTTKDLALLIATVAPPLSAAISVGSSVLLVWLAAKIVGKSGRLPRPWPQISLVELPRSGLMVLGAALLASAVLTGFGGLLARSVGAAALMAYGLQGLAVIHVLTKSVSGRTGILFAVYFTFLVFGWPFLLYAMAGIADSLFGLRARKLAGAPPSPPIV